MKSQMAIFAAWLLVVLTGSLEAVTAKSTMRWGGAGVAGAGLIVALRMHKKAAALEKKLAENAAVLGAKRSRNRALAGALLGAGIAVGSLLMQNEASVPLAPRAPEEQVTLVPIQEHQEVVSAPSDLPVVIQQSISTPFIVQESMEDASTKEILVVNNVSEVVVSGREARLHDVARMARAQPGAQGYVAFSQIPRGFSDDEKIRRAVEIGNRFHSLLTQGDRTEAEEAEFKAFRTKNWADFFDTLFDVVEVPSDHYCAYHAYFFYKWWHGSGLARNTMRPVAFAADLSMIHVFRAQIADRLEAEYRRRYSGEALEKHLDIVVTKYRSRVASSSVWDMPSSLHRSVRTGLFKKNNLGCILYLCGRTKISLDMRYYIFLNDNHWNAAILKPEVVAFLKKDKEGNA